MTRFPHPETAEVRPSAVSADPVRQPVPVRPGAILLPFPAPGTRRRRSAPHSGERRGEILFFLGVRYERLAS